MLRFLRLYNKWILAIGGTLLLVSWAMSGAISMVSQSAAQSGSTWATFGPKGTKVTFGQLEEIRRELRVLDTLNQIFRTPVVPIPGADRDPAHWFLLTKEAEAAGLVGSIGDATPVLQALAEASASTPESVASLIAAQSGTNTRIVRETLAKVNGILRLRELVATLPRYSDVRLQQAASESLLGVGGDVLVLDARKLPFPTVPEPTADEIAKHLETYGSIDPGQGPFGFGYRLPDRMKLEWIQISEAAVRSALEQSGALDSLTLKKRFAADPAKFNAPPPQPGGDPLALYPAYEASVRQKVLDELVAERMTEIAKFASDQLAIAQRGIPKDGPFLRLPEDWRARMLDLRSLAQAIGEQFKIPFPAYGSLGDRWMSVRDIEAIPGLGTATTTRFGPTPIRLGILLGKLREFGRGDDTMPMQALVASPPLTAGNRDLYIVRVLDTDPARAPTSAEEAGPSLVADLEAIARFELLKTMLDDLRAEAVAKGLRSVGEQFSVPVEFVARFQEADPNALTFGIKFPSALPGLGGDPKAIQSIVREALKLPKTILASELPAEERTIVVPVEDRLAVVMVQVTDLYPLTQEGFRSVSRSPQAHNALLGEGTIAALDTSFGLDALMRRHAFALTRAETDEG
jgi:hypothetical protein